MNIILTKTVLVPYAVTFVSTRYVVICILPTRRIITVITARTTAVDIIINTLLHLIRT